MSKHTPGPYTSYNNFGDQMICAEGPKGQLEIAIVFKQAEYGNLPVQANATLFKAAPKMLEALKRALERTDKAARSGIQIQGMMSDLRQIIAEAEGEE